VGSETHAPRPPPSPWWSGSRRGCSSVYRPSHIDGPNQAPGSTRISSAAPRSYSGLGCRSAPRRCPELSPPMGEATVKHKGRGLRLSIEDRRSVCPPPAPADPWPDPARRPPLKRLVAAYCPYRRRSSLQPSRLCDVVRTAGNRRKGASEQACLVGRVARSSLLGVVERTPMKSRRSARSPALAPNGGLVDALGIPAAARVWWT